MGMTGSTYITVNASSTKRAKRSVMGEKTSDTGVRPNTEVNALIVGVWQGIRVDEAGLQAPEEERSRKRGLERNQWVQADFEGRCRMDGARCKK